MRHLKYTGNYIVIYSFELHRITLRTALRVYVVRCYVLLVKKNDDDDDDDDKPENHTYYGDDLLIVHTRTVR